MRILIAYYTFTGRTRKAAKELSDFFKSRGHETSLEEIVPKGGYSNLTAYLIGCPQALIGWKVGIKTIESKPQDFEVIVVLTPTWASTSAPPAYSFTRSLPEARTGQRGLAISTCQGSPGNSARKLADVLSSKGYDVITSFPIGDLGELKDVLERRIELAPSKKQP